jgi:predicted amidohydrolase
MATSQVRITATAEKDPVANRRILRAKLLLRPRGKILVEGSRNTDDIVVTDLDRDLIREVRNTWQFYRERRPENYGAITAL